MINPEAPTPDELLERDIDDASAVLRRTYEVGTRHEQDMAWRIFKQLINSRSPMQIHKMEFRQGLR